MQKNKFVPVLSILLFISVIINILLLSKIQSNSSSTFTNSDLVGVYHYESKGYIEIIDDKNATLYGNTDSTYSIDGNTITFTYYISLSPLEDGNCYAIDDTQKGKMVLVNDCKQKMTREGKRVNNGIIYENKLYTKVS